MEAKDTAMNGELQNQLDGWLDLVVDVIDAKRKRRINSSEAVLFINWIEDGIALISFKAGIREVVEWIESRDKMELICRAFWEEEWQTQLEKWGV